MTWSNTYSHTLAVAVDILTASTFWNTEDVTVSSLCGLALRAGRVHSFLGFLGRGLNWVQPGHCEMAISADISRAQSTINLLEPNATN